MHRPTRIGLLQRVVLSASKGLAEEIQYPYLWLNQHVTPSLSHPFGRPGQLSSHLHLVILYAFSPAPRIDSFSHPVSTYSHCLCAQGIHSPPLLPHTRPALVQSATTVHHIILRDRVFPKGDCRRCFK